MLNKINIIGAGVCGLFLGYCLKKNGFNPIIYEKDKALSCLLYTSPSPRDP